MLNKTFNKSVSVVNTTSKKYMPKIKSGLQNVGSKVVTTGKQSIPFLQNLTRKTFEYLGIKKKSKTKKRH
jgi:hypothetical protein